MCDYLKLRQTYSQAYHHQANGRKEVAGQQIIERFRKIQMEDKILWPEALPAVLDRMHDIPVEGVYLHSKFYLGGIVPWREFHIPPLKSARTRNNFSSVWYRWTGLWPNA